MKFEESMEEIRRLYEISKVEYTKLAQAIVDHCGAIMADYNDDIGVNRMTELLRTHNEEFDRLDKKWRETLAVEHALSASYVRIRSIVGTINLPSMPVEELWTKTEEAAQKIVSALEDYDHELEALTHLKGIPPQVALGLTVLRQRHLQALGAIRR